ncbi:conserved hypothetical protein [Streptomyces misionensis JCM 4497]
MAAARAPGAPHHRPRRGLRHRLLVRGHRCLPLRSGRAGPRPPGDAAGGARPGRGGRHYSGGAADLGRHRGDHGRRVRARDRARGRGGLARRLGVGDGRAPRGARRPVRDDHLARRRHRHAPAGRHHAERRARPARHRRTPRPAGPGDPVRAGDEVHAGRARPGPAPLSGGRAHTEPAAHRGHPRRAAARVDEAGAPGAGRVRGHAVRARRRAGRAAWPGRGGAADLPAGPGRRTARRTGRGTLAVRRPGRRAAARGLHGDRRGPAGGLGAGRVAGHPRSAHPAGLAGRGGAGAGAGRGAGRRAGGPAAVHGGAGADPSRRVPMSRTKCRKPFRNTQHP